MHIRAIFYSLPELLSDEHYTYYKLFLPEILFTLIDCSCIYVHINLKTVQCALCSAHVNSVTFIMKEL